MDLRRDVLERCWPNRCGEEVREGDERSTVDGPSWGEGGAEASVNQRDGLSELA